MRFEPGKLAAPYRDGQPGVGEARPVRRPRLALMCVHRLPKLLHGRFGDAV